MYCSLKLVEGFYFYFYFLMALPIVTDSREEKLTLLTQVFGKFIHHTEYILPTVPTYPVADSQRPLSWFFFPRWTHSVGPTQVDRSDQKPLPPHPPSPIFPVPYQAIFSHLVLYLRTGYGTGLGLNARSITKSIPKAAWLELVHIPSPTLEKSCPQ